jgi:hypothetical protein
VSVVSTESEHGTIDIGQTRNHVMPIPSPYGPAPTGEIRASVCRRGWFGEEWI